MLGRQKLLHLILADFLEQSRYNGADLNHVALLLVLGFNDHSFDDHLREHTLEVSLLEQTDGSFNELEYGSEEFLGRSGVSEEEQVDVRDL